MTRAAIYLRQSVTREDSVSLDLQEAACRAYCEQHGYTVVMVKADPGISGRTFNRSAVRAVMEAVDAGEVDVVVLWKWSRLSRSRRDWAVAADRVDVAGGRIESATEPMDISTAAGRLGRGMMVEFAAFESERIGDIWRETHRRRVKQGLPPNGKPRFGYTYDPESKRFAPDPVTAPILAACYRRYLAGESFYSLVKWLSDEGIRTVEGYGTSGGEWSHRSLRRVLDSGFGAGFIRYGGEVLPGVHEPVITRDEWAQYQAARAVRRTYRTSERSVYVLSGLVRCACGSSMTAGQFGAARTPKFRCKAAHEKRAHQGGYVMMHLVEEAVLRWLREHAEDIETHAAAQTALADRATDITADARKAARQVVQLEEQLTRLTIRLSEGTVPESAYIAARDEITARLERAQARVEAAERTRARLPGSAGEARALLDAWEILGVAQRREALRRLISHVLVEPGRPRARVVVVPVWSEESRHHSRS